LQPENEHYERFAEFIKLDVNRARLIGLKSSEQKKAVYANELTDISTDDIKGFATDLESGSVSFVGLQDGENGEAGVAVEDVPEDNEEAGDEEL